MDHTHNWVSYSRKAEVSRMDVGLSKPPVPHHHHHHHSPQSQKRAKTVMADPPAPPHPGCTCNQASPSCGAEVIPWVWVPASTQPNWKQTPLGIPTTRYWGACCTAEALPRMWVLAPTKETKTNGKLPRNAAPLISKAWWSGNPWPCVRFSIPVVVTTLQISLSWQ